MNEKFLDSDRAKLLGGVLRLVPVLLAAGVLVPDARAALPAVCLLALGMLALWFPMERAHLPLVGVSYVFLQDIALRYSFSVCIIVTAVFTVLLGGYLLLYAAKGEKFTPPLPLHFAVTVGAAVVMTLYQCAGYFATGAHGAGLTALLRSYRSLGFHPNWRTVLFSTIMMVVLITWPRKFPRLSGAVPSGFVGLLLVAALNIAQYWDPAHSPVADLGVLRVPLSALSMLLIFIAWEEVPWGAFKQHKS